MENETEKEYQIITYAWIKAKSLEEAEAMYEDGDYFVDYHVIEDEDGQQYDQDDIERLSDVSN